MKKLLMLLVLASAMPLASMAQDDDVYFTPSKAPKEVKKAEKPTYYSGSNRDVDEYNRRGQLNSWYQKIGSDSLGNDIITFQGGPGVYPDSVYGDTAYVYPGSARFSNDDDYTYTRRMSRWDGYYDPWFYSNYYYGPWRYGWYDPWYDPWYYGYTGWYDPWYYGYGGWYGWGYPYYGWYNWGWPGGRYVYNGGHTGTANHWGNGTRGFSRDGYVPVHGGRSANGDFWGYRGGNSNSTPSSQHRGNGTRAWSNNSDSRFGGARTRSENANNFPSSNMSRGSFGGGSGSFGGGSFGGASRGGGSFGGSRGGGSFGGRR